MIYIPRIILAIIFTFFALAALSHSMSHAADLSSSYALKKQGRVAFDRSTESADQSASAETSANVEDIEPAAGAQASEGESEDLGRQIRLPRKN